MKKSLLVDAKMLAAFANLKSADADTFRNAVAPGFVPEGWWTGQALPMMKGATSMPFWMIEQERLTDAWRSQFSPEACLDLIVSAAKESQLEKSLNQLTEQMPKMGNEAASEFIARQELPKPEIYPYQHVVMLLALQPWRARICEKCGKYFVKDKPRDRYCSKPCSKQAILDSKRKSWGSHGNSWRPKRSSKKQRKTGGK
jgi:hypothetical protein